MPPPGSHHPRRPKVLVAMSGGVDSSVAAALLQRDGYDVVGCFMRLGSDDSVEHAQAPEACRLTAQPSTPTPQPSSSSLPLLKHQGCCSLNDAADARLVAAMLNIPLYVLNFKRDFGRIIDYFVGEYNAGRTPNPCVRCNDWLKFGKLADYARSIDAQFVATGHYARIVRDGSGARLMRGIDTRKDQSYVLFGTRRQELEHMLLPVGEYDKPRIRAIAQELGLPVFDKPDSQEICFVPDNDYARLVKEKSPGAVSPGDVLDRAGNVIGRHDGQQHFTIGQRRGLGVTVGHPLYVIDKDAAANTITVGQKDDLLSSGLVASQANWLIDRPAPGVWRNCRVKIRYNAQPVPASLRVTAADTFEVRFDQPQSAVSPGQAAVCYDDDHLIAGGWIDRKVAEWPSGQVAE